MREERTGGPGDRVGLFLPNCPYYVLFYYAILRIGAVVLRNTRRVRLLLSSAYPDQALFMLVVTRLQPG